MSDSNPSGGANSGTDRLRGTAEEARDAAAGRWEDAKREARDTAERTVRDARERAEDEAERGKRVGAGQVHQWASALDRAAGELGRDSMQGQVLSQASEGLDDVARSIEGRSVGELVEAVADFGRRNPVAFVGGAMMAGFALSRFATASPPRPEWDAPDHRPRRPAPPPPSPSAPVGSVAAGSPTSPGTGPGGSPASGAGSAFTPGGASPGGPSPSSPGGASPGAPDAGKDDDDELTLTDSMRPEGGAGSGPTTAPGTASAPSGTDRPYPSAGPVPGSDDDKDEEKDR